MAIMNLPYLWAPKGKRRRYYYYRRDGRRVPVADAEGRRPDSNTDLPAFLEAYRRTHAAFESTPPDPAGRAPRGSLADVVGEFRRSNDYAAKGARTRRDYDRHLDHLVAAYGDLPVATLPREFVTGLRDRGAATPRTTNYRITVLRLLLYWAADRPARFGLPAGWVNPAARPRRLKGDGPGHRPWHDWEIDQLCRRWPVGTWERTAFELLLCTGQRGQDVAAMRRPQYRRGWVEVVQAKTGARVAIPAAKRLRAALEAWLSPRGRTVRPIAMLPGVRGGALGVDAFRHRMAGAYRAAGLEGVTTHGLRHTTATILAEAGVDFQGIAAITGHETAAMVARYTRQKREARRSVSRLERARRDAPAVNTDGSECKHPDADTG